MIAVVINKTIFEASPRQKGKLNMAEINAEAEVINDTDLDDIFGGETDFEEEAPTTEETPEEVEYVDDDDEADIREDAEDTTPSGEEDVEAEPEQTVEENATVENYQFLNAKVNHEEVKYDLSDPAQKDTVIRNIQKGMDYDRVKGQVAKLEAEAAELKYLKDSLDSIKGEFSNGYELLDDALAEILVKSEAENGRVVNKEDAIKRVRSNRESVFAQTSQNAEQLKQKSIEQFANLYPNVRPEDIPQEVWNEFTDTSDLVGSWQRYESSKKNSEFETMKAELDATKKELETLKLNEKNRQRSTGNRSTSGNSSKSSTDKMLDDIFGGW